MCRGEDHYAVKNAKLGIPHHCKGRKDIHAKRIADKGYMYLCYHADGTSRKPEKYKPGDDWKSALDEKCASYFNEIPWLNPAASKNSNLAWFLKDEIINISKTTKITGDRTFSKLCNLNLDTKTKYGYEFNRNTPKRVVDFVLSNRWTDNFQKIWEDWKNSYDPSSNIT